MIDDKKHPISPEDVGACFSGNVIDICSCDARICIQDVVDLCLDNKPVLEKVSTECGVPKKDTGVRGEGIRSLLPGIGGVSIKFAIPE